MTTEYLPAEDLLTGTKQIAAFLGLSEFRVSHAIRMKRIPFFRIGGRIMGRKSSLTQWLADQEAAAMNDNPPALKAVA